MAEAYPLHWPEEWPRTSRPGSSQFKTSITGALNNVQDSIRKFANDSGKKVENIVISSNVALGEQKPIDPGVAVYFSWDGISTCIAVDRYKKVEDNLQAIHHCIEAERTKLRHGGINLVRAAFRGYAALPPVKTNALTWWNVFGVDKTSSHEAIEKAYKKRRSEEHPDKGGDKELFIVIEQAWEIYQAQRKRS